MRRPVTFLSTIALALIARTSLAQHEDCYLTNSGMSGPSRCQSNGIVGQVSVDTCMLSAVGGLYRARDPLGGVGTGPAGDAVYLGWGFFSSGGGPYWTLTDDFVASSDNVRVQASCAPSSRFAGGQVSSSANVVIGRNTLPDGPPNAPIAYGYGAGALCVDRIFTGNARVFNDSVDSTFSSNAWSLEVWGNPDNMGGSGGCTTGGQHGVSTTYVVSWLQPSVQLPDANQALCGFVRISGPFIQSSAYVSISASGNSQFAYASPGGSDTNPSHFPSATVQCLYF